MCEGPAAAGTDLHRLSGLSHLRYCPALWISGHGSGLGAESSAAPTPEFSVEEGNQHSVGSGGRSFSVFMKLLL